MVKKISVLFTLLACCMLPMKAFNAVKMTHPDKESIFLLSSNPKVSMADKTVVITSDAGDKIELDQNGKTAKFEFIDTSSTSIEEVGIDAAIFNINQSSIEGRNLTVGSTVEIYDISGKKISTNRVDETGFVNISLSELPKGVYLFNSIDKNFKFYKK